jgi:hypothetical protein
MALWMLLNVARAASPEPAESPFRDWISYRRAVEASHLADFYAIDPAKRDRIDVGLVIEPKDKSVQPKDIRLTVAKSGTVQEIAINEKGRFELVPDPELMAANPPIRINRPKGEKFDVSVSLFARIPAGDRTSYVDWMTALDQANRAIREQAGMLRFFVPTLRSLTIRFSDGPQTVRIDGGQQPKTYATDSANTVHLRRDPALEKPGVVLVLSARPTEVELDE